MKSCFFILIIFYTTSSNNFVFSNRNEESFILELSLLQEAPFYFLKPVPPTIKLPDKIDLSFFRNQSVVSEYRYRLEIPAGGATAIDRNFTRWSPWISFDFIEFIIPIVDREGGYKLNIEYRSSKGGEILKFEKLFYVYRVNPGTYVEINKTESASVSGKTTSKTTPANEKPITKTQPVSSTTTSKTTATINLSSKRLTPVIGKIIIKPKSVDVLSINNLNPKKGFVNYKQIILQDGKGNIAQKTVSIVKNSPNESAKKTVPTEILNVKEHNRLLAESIERKDTVLFKTLLRDEAEIILQGPDGGNIFHLMNDTISNDKVISLLKNKGISINEADNNGNSPLHVAILSGESEYAMSLINQGADLNIKNKLELSPLHLAAFLNDRQITNQLMLKGAEIDIKGNSGYTPLHIASELNHIRLAQDLLYMGANSRIKTDQKLTPKVIAKIQDNNEMTKLISKKGSYTLNLPMANSARSTSFLSTVKLIPKYDFRLPYDKGLVKKRQFNKIAGIISVPVFAICAAGTVYFRSEAGNFYSSYKNAESIDIAKHYYNKTMKFDTYTYISGGVSLVSAFGIIRSAIRNKSISNKMRKTLY
jgi:hypothetical protein